jgi:hypothetical protein
MQTKYVAEFRVSDERTEEQKKPLESNEVIDKGRKFDSKVIGKGLTTGVAVTVMASRIVSTMQATSNAIVGDSVAQRKLDNRMAYLNEGLSVFGGVGIALLINPATALATAGALTVSYGLRAFQQSQQNAIKQAGWFVESVINQEKQTRLVKDITGGRL